MFSGAFGRQKTSSLMNEYASLLGDALLRRRARVAEHSARIEAELASG
jgi:two-component system, cell cycle sensor histidine kinase PleC